MLDGSLSAVDPVSGDADKRGGVPSQRMRLAGAINETLSFCFVVRSAEAALEDPGFRIAPFTSANSTIGTAAVSIYRMHAVPIEQWPGWHIRSHPPNRRDSQPLDVLVPVRAPRGGLPAVLRPGEPYYFWVDVSIPKGTREGVYTSAITLTGEDDDAGELALELTVWPFVLPDDTPVVMIAELDHGQLFSHHVSVHGRPYRLDVDDWRDDPGQAELDALLTSTLRMLRRHRITAVLPGLAPIARVTANDGLRMDWGQYDAVIEPCMTGRAFLSRVAQRVLPLPLPAEWTGSTGDLDSRADHAARLLRRYVRECADHFRRKGWLDRAYATAPGEAEPTRATASKTERFASLAREGSGDVAILSRLFPQDMKDYGWTDFPCADFTDSVDIWMPKAQFYDAVAMEAQREAGARTWVAADRPPFSGSTAIHAPASAVRVLAWQAGELGAQAMFLGHMNSWPDAERSPAPEDCVAKDPRVLLYPGGPFGLKEPVASVRLKHLRRGMQDAAYGELLRSHGLGHLAEAISHSITPRQGTAAYRTHFADGRPNSWVNETATYEDARRIMAKELMRTSAGGPPEERLASFARSTAWRQFMRKTRQLRIQVDGTRVRFAGTRTKPAFEVETTLTIANGTRVPVAADVRFADLPDGWKAEASRRVGPIPPGESRLVKLQANAAGILARSDGSLELSVEVATDDGVVHRAAARVSCVTAPPLGAPLRIDGDLSDWPVGTINVASGFSFISGPGNPMADNAGPRHRTLAFVLRDADNLYIAVNSEADARLSPSRSRRKSIQYDDMIPVGEELVEILLDPLNAGTRSPADLYHIVVKHSGADMEEKGIRFEPPCGLREPWPVDIEVVTHVSPGRWTAELRIPLRAFGGTPADHAVWGFNVTRFDAVNQEFSTWSGALRNAYDPVSLGNLFLP